MEESNTEGREQSLGKFTEEARRLCPSAPLILVGTKTDLRDTQNDLSKVTTKTSQLSKVAKSLGALDYLECSAHRDDESVRDLFKEIINISVSRKKKKALNEEILTR